MLKYLANVSKPSEKKRKRDDDYDKEYEKAKLDKSLNHLGRTVGHG